MGNDAQQTIEQNSGSRFAARPGYIPSIREPAASGDGVASQRSRGRDECSLTLFDSSPDWQAEWQGMPEFVQERQREYAKIIVRFRSKEDLDEFARLIGQKLNRNSQCTWHPELTRGEITGNGRVKYVAKP